MRIKVATVSDVRNALSKLPDWARVELADGADLVLDVDSASGEHYDATSVVFTDDPDPTNDIDYPEN